MTPILIVQQNPVESSLMKIPRSFSSLWDQPNMLLNNIFSVLSHSVLLYDNKLQKKKWFYSEVFVILQQLDCEMCLRRIIELP